MKFVKLSTICDIQAGGTPARSNQSFWKNGNIPWVKIGDFDGKYINSTSEAITQEGLAASSAKLFPKGTIVYTIFATLGEVAILNVEASTNQAIAGLILKDTRFSVDYLYYYLKSLQPYVNGIGRGVAQNNINLSILRNFEVPCKGITEQDRITRSLETAEHIIGLLHKQFDKLDELIKARFVEMFGDWRANGMHWQTKRLSEIAIVGSSKRVFVKELCNKGVPFYRGTEIGLLATGNKVVPRLFIEPQHYRRLCQESGCPRKGDLLLPSICPDGRIWNVDENAPFYFKDGRVLWIHDINKMYHPIYILHSLRERLIANYASVASGTTFAEMKIFSLKNIEIYDVPLPLQKKFASLVEQVDKSKVVVQLSQKRIDVLHLLW